MNTAVHLVQQAAWLKTSLSSFTIPIHFLCYCLEASSVSCFFLFFFLSPTERLDPLLTGCLNHRNGLLLISGSCGCMKKHSVLNSSPNRVEGAATLSKNLLLSVTFSFRYSPNPVIIGAKINRKCRGLLTSLVLSSTPYQHTL